MGSVTGAAHRGLGGPVPRPHRAAPSRTPPRAERSGGRHVHEGARIDPAHVAGGEVVDQADVVPRLDERPPRGDVKPAPPVTRILWLGHQFYGTRRWCGADRPRTSTWAPTPQAPRLVMLGLAPPYGVAVGSGRKHDSRREPLIWVNLARELEQGHLPRVPMLNGSLTWPA